MRFKVFDRFSGTDRPEEVSRVLPFEDRDLWLIVSVKGYPQQPIPIEFARLKRDIKDGGQIKFNHIQSFI